MERKIIIRAIAEWMRRGMKRLRAYEMKMKNGWMERERGIKRLRDGWI